MDSSSYTGLPNKLFNGLSSVKSTLYRHRQRSQKLKDYKSYEWNSLPPKKRPLNIDIDNHDEKRRKYSSSSSTTFNEDNNAQMAAATAALESQQMIAKFLSNPYNLLLA